MAGLQISGIASGLDTDSIITQLMSIEQQPRTRMAQQQLIVQTRQSALQSADTSLSNLKLAAQDLRSASLWVPVESVSSSDSSVVSAQLTAGAAPGGYTVTVSSLASADSRTYAWNDGGGDVTQAGGDLTIDYNANGVANSKTFSLSGMSLDDAVAKINGDDGSPVWAVNVNGKLSISRKDTGDHANWGFTNVSGAAVVGAPTSSRDGTDATYSIAGDPTTYSSHDGNASDGLPGVQLTLKAIGTATVSVTPPQVDPEAVKTKIKAFISAYNASVDLVRGQLNQKPVANPQNDQDAIQGVLYGDTSLSSVLSQMRQTISEAGLDQLGITVPSTGSGTSDDALAGKLTFKESTFDDAWASNSKNVQAKLGSTTSSGFAQAFEKVLDPVTRAGDGLLDQRVNEANSDLAYIKDQLADMDTRLQSKEDYLRAQFTAMETALSQSQSQSSWLTSQLSSS
jgi:flagellar hook-associated protein 2